MRRHRDAGEREAAEHERLLRRIDLRADDRMGGGDLDGESLRDEPLRSGRREEAVIPEKTKQSAPAVAALWASAR